MKTVVLSFLMMFAIPTAIEVPKAPEKPAVVWGQLSTVSPACQAARDRMRWSDLPCADHSDKK